MAKAKRSSKSETEKLVKLTGYTKSCPRMQVCEISFSSSFPLENNRYIFIVILITYLPSVLFSSIPPVQHTSFLIDIKPAYSSQGRWVATSWFTCSAIYNVAVCVPGMLLSVCCCLFCVLCVLHRGEEWEMLGLGFSVQGLLMLLRLRQLCVSLGRGCWYCDETGRSRGAMSTGGRLCFYQGSTERSSLNLLLMLRRFTSHPHDSHTTST